MRAIRLTALAVMLVLVASISLAADKPAATTVKSTFDKTDLDTTASACVDFNQYANGGWLKKNPIPAAYSNWGVGNVLAESNRDQLRTILENAAKSNAPAGSNEQKIGDYYMSCMNEKAVEEAGLKPIQQELDRIAAIKDVAGLQAAVAHLHALGLGPLFGSGSQQDRKNSEQVIFGVGQGGLGLPDRDYYLKDDAKSKEIRDKYLAYVQKIF